MLAGPPAAPSGPICNGDGITSRTTMYALTSHAGSNRRRSANAVGCGAVP